MGDIGRRSESSKRWNLDIDSKGQKKEDLPSSEVGNAIVDEQTANDLKSLLQGEITNNPAMNPQQTGTQQASVTSAQSSYPISAPQEKTTKSPTIDPQPNCTKQASVAIAAPSRYQEFQIDLQTEEKKQDDHDVGSPSAAKPKDDHDVGSSGKANHELQGGGEKQNGHAVASSSEAKPKYNHDEEYPSEGKPKSEETSSEAEDRPPLHVILSLTDDYYKETMWRHYRILGKTRDSGREAEIGSEIFSLFKQKLGENGNFFKRVHDQDVVVNDDKALASKYRPCNSFSPGFVLLSVLTKCFSSNNM